MKSEEARKKMCPITTRSVRIERCQADECMAWVSNEAEECMAWKWTEEDKSEGRCGLMVGNYMPWLIEQIGACSR